MTRHEHEVRRTILRNVEKSVSTIVWRDCQTDPPDVGRNVLVFSPNPHASPDLPVWLGWKDAREWFWADGSTIEKPELWAPIPHPFVS